MRSVPNILSIFRICLVPVFIIAFFADGHEIKYYAMFIYALASFTDVLDGFLARKFKASTKLGKFLDPLGDKMMTVSVLVCIAVDEIIPFWAVIVTVLKELLMTIGGLIVRRKASSELPPSNILGKVSTIVFFLVCLTLMAFRSIPNYAATAMIAFAVALTFAALASYFITYINIMKNRGRELANTVTGTPPDYPESR